MLEIISREGFPMKRGYIPPLTERGTKSVTSISPKVKIPPPPIPWILLPMIIIVKLVAIAATMEPTAKNSDDARTN
jgi:hypothetical protein